MSSAPWWHAFADRPTRRVAAGAFVYLKSDAAQSVYLLRSGLIKTGVTWRDGRELILRVVLPGGLFGETRLAALGSGERARALEESAIVEIPTIELLARLAHEPGALAGFLEALARRRDGGASSAAGARAASMPFWIRMERPSVLTAVRREP